MEHPGIQHDRCLKCQALKTKSLENFMGVSSQVLRRQLYRLEVDMSGCVKIMTSKKSISRNVQICNYRIICVILCASLIAFTFTHTYINIYITDWFLLILTISSIFWWDHQIMLRHTLCQKILEGLGLLKGIRKIYAGCLSSCLSMPSWPLGWV